MKDLSIIIPSFNTKDITKQTIISLQDALRDEQNLRFEILVVDNASSDGSPDMLRSTKGITPFFLTKNGGYAKANNYALQKAQGKYILFLNSDMVIQNVSFSSLCHYLEEHQDVGGLTVRVELESGGIDPASHRGFPTLWRTFCYYTGLAKLGSYVPALGRFFSGYHLSYLDLSIPHEIDSPSGAFFLTRKLLMDKLGGFDEDFFMYGEDLDLAYRIKELSSRVMYYPRYTVVHLKYKSGLGTANKETKRTIRYHFFDAMQIFYTKHYADNTFFLMNWLVYVLISIRKLFV